LAGLYVLNASVAQAGAWEEFETRCLTPMENVELFDLEGLSVRQDLMEIEFGSPPDTQGFEIFIYTYGQDEFQDDDFMLMVSQKTGYCMLGSAASNEKADLVAASTWANASLKAGRYVDQGPLLENFVYLESNLWREPRLWVTLQVDGSGVQFIVQETNLES
jgi:hypothetical protein